MSGLSEKLKALRIGEGFTVYDDKQLNTTLTRGYQIGIRMRRKKQSDGTYYVWKGSEIQTSDSESLEDVVLTRGAWRG